jgi:rod shape-determining protein MreD
VGLRRIRLILVVITLLVLQTTVFTHLRVFDAVPDLLLVAAIAMAYDSGPLAGAVFGFAGGLCIDLFLTTPLGLSALTYALTAYGVGVFQGGMIRETRTIAPVLGGVGGIVGGILFVVIGGIAGRGELFALHNIQVIVVSAVYDAIVAYAIFPFVRWAAKTDVGRAWPDR